MLTAMSTAKPLLGKDRAHVWFAGDPAQSDLALFNHCLNTGTERAYREALALWRGDPLHGLELGDPSFDEWVSTFRSDMVGVTHRHLSDRLKDMRGKDVPPGLVIALCELIVRIEPTDTEANETLVRTLAVHGDTAAATKRFRNYGAALAELDVNVPRALADFVSSLSASQPAPTPQSFPLAPTLQAQPPQRSAWDGPRDVSIEAHRERPTVALVRPNGMRPTPDLFSFAHSEVMFQLARFRSMRCFERDKEPEAETSASLISRVKLSDAVDHDYRLLLWDEPAAKSIYLRCVNARRQDTVSCVRLDYEALADRNQAEVMIASAVNSLEQDILNDKGATRGSVFGRWLEAYKLLTQWTHSSDRQALAILEDLAGDEQGRQLSLVHSSISSILMIQRLMVPIGTTNANTGLDRARDCIDHALRLDDLEPFNHVILGWLRVQSNDHDRALLAFDDALALNPYSSRTLIAAAEANAYCGQIERARSLSNQALNLAGRYIPPWFHGYLANIAYLAGDLEQCVTHLRRAPENVHSSLLAIAAHQERGDLVSASTARVSFEREVRRNQPFATVDGDALSRWIVWSNMTRDQATRRRLFNSLELAGVQVGSPTVQVGGPTVQVGGPTI
ncbi:bacterial transcriptional activator domain-containing protein [Acuticoccus kandeliae]|uniref:bacterial transcriptional activator domain-containing protein n=1 Tax=Acuticoccus kandeliae TaxID=2073160 RepID=UPI0013007F02|nr:bacterial transcriptional activator domain-containing protein [Acuticoccus kandeliae]